MITIRQHIPSFVDHRDAQPVACVATQDELLAVPWVRQWKEDHGQLPFYQFSLADADLMVESDGGRHWWVVGRITEGLNELTLPKWEPRRAT